MKKLLVLAGSAAVFLAGAAFAGEVKGPPQRPGDNTEPSENVTAAPEHAKSACAFSGLNDFDGEGDELLNMTQTAADAFKLYGYRPGVQGRGDPDHPVAPAEDGLCKGGPSGGPEPA
jgi:hypothetical protein